MASALDSIRALFKAVPAEVAPPTIDAPLTAPALTRNDALCKGLTQADVDAMWEAARNQQVLDFKVGLAWVNPGTPGRRTKVTQRCIDYYTGGVAKIQAADADLKAHLSPELEKWGKAIEGARRSYSVGYTNAGIDEASLPLSYQPYLDDTSRRNQEQLVILLSSVLCLPSRRADEIYWAQVRIGGGWDPSGTLSASILRGLLTGDLSRARYMLEGMGRGNNAHLRYKIEFEVNQSESAGSSDWQFRNRTSTSDGYVGPWYTTKLDLGGHVVRALAELLPTLREGPLPSNREVLDACIEVMRTCYPPEIAPLVLGIQEWGPAKARNSYDVRPTPPETNPLLASLPYFAQRIYLEKTREAAINEHTATVYGMLRDYEEGKILLPLDDLNARAREALADVKRTDESDPASYQYPVDAYAMKHIGRNSYAEAQFQAMRAQLVAAGGYYLPGNVLVDGPDLIFRREDAILSVSEQAQLDRAKDTIQARYARITQVLEGWDYVNHPRLPTEQEWAALGVARPGTAVSDVLLVHALEQQALTKAAVDQASTEARDVLTKSFQSKMTALAVSTLAQVQAIEGSVPMDRVAYEQAKAQALGDAQAQVDAAKGRFMAARGQALAAVEAKARRLERIAPVTSTGKLQAVKNYLDQAASATVPDDVYPSLAQATGLLDQVQADIEAQAATERRRYEDAQLLAGARETLNRALVQAAEGFKAMNKDAALAAQVAAEEARQAHIQAQRDTQAAADGLAALQAQIATYRLATVPVQAGTQVSGQAAQAAADALAALQTARGVVGVPLTEQVATPVPMPSLVDLTAQIRTARASVGIENPSALQVIALRTRAEELEAKVPGALAAIQEAYDTEIAAARAANQARINASKADDDAALATLGGDEAKNSAGLGGQEVALGAAAVAAKLILFR